MRGICVVTVGLKNGDMKSDGIDMPENKLNSYNIMWFKWKKIQCKKTNWTHQKRTDCVKGMWKPQGKENMSLKNWKGIMTYVISRRTQNIFVHKFNTILRGV